ncbi:MAG: helix-turn-helix transcriptional regulator [Alphaproteobacteria bacterium]|nr:helix-turn-helix transcriptional regulator [Alphaproteobacteria bacterium]
MAPHRDILGRYEDDLFGIPVVILNAVIKETDSRGNETITIPDEEGLAAAIAMARALCPIKLQADDIRMMRKTLGMKAKDFAGALGISPSRVSRMEKNTQGLGPFSEQAIRQFVCARLKRQAPAINYDPAEIATMEIVEGDVTAIEFERVRLKMAESQTKTDEWDLAA